MFTMKTFRLCLFLLLGVPDCASAVQSIARVWNEQALAAIRIDTPHPPVQARNLFHLSVVMYDAWAAYTNVAVGYIYHGKATATDVALARRESISYAAYRLLRERYALSRNSTNTRHVGCTKWSPASFEQYPRTPPPAGLDLVALTVSNYFLDGARRLRSSQICRGGGGATRRQSTLVTGTNGTWLWTSITGNRWRLRTHWIKPAPTGPIRSFSARNG